MTIEDYISLPFDHSQELGFFLNGSARKIIFDVGACEGEETIKYNRNFSKTEIYSFEPLPKNFQRLVENLKKFGCTDNVHANWVALSDVEGESKFYVSSGAPETQATDDWNYGNKSSSLLSPNAVTDHFSWLAFGEEILVRTIRLDGFIERNCIDHIDLLHIDVQGAEKLVLNGLADRSRIVKCIWLEVSHLELYRGQPLKSDIELMMETMGFELVSEFINKFGGDQFYVNVRHFSKIKRLRFKLLKLFKNIERFTRNVLFENK